MRPQNTKSKYAEVQDYIAIYLLLILYLKRYRSGSDDMQRLIRMT